MADMVALKQAEDRFLASVGLEADPRELVLERSNVKVRALVSGEGPPIVFIHGGSTAGAGWAELLGRVHPPVHFFWGEDDPWAGTASAQKMMESLPDATLEMVPGAGHAPWLDALDHAVASIRAHLRG